jgi:asparagine synthase (glutamine-hydrolysing)
MAVSLEAREPLLDHRLIEFAARLPDGARVRGGTGKWLMKQSLRGTLPDDVLFRPKMGFVTPISAWLRGPLAQQARGIGTVGGSGGGALARTGWFDSAAIAALAEAHIAGRSDNGRLLWQLLMLDKALARLDPRIC